MPDPKAKGKGFGEQLAEKAFDKATEKFLDPVLNYIGDLCSEFAGYLAEFDEHVRDLREAALDLNATRETLQNRVVRAERSTTNKKASAKVKEWYRKEELTRADAAKLEEKGKREDGRLCLGKWCVGRLCYGKNVVKCCKRLGSLREEGNNIKDEELLEQGAPDRHELLGNFEDKFHDLEYKITDIEGLQKTVRRLLQDAKAEKTMIANDYEIDGWLKKVTLEVNEGESYKKKEEEHIQEFQRLGSGSTSRVQYKVEKCIERIVNLQREGSNFLVNLRVAVGLGASCNNEAPPQAGASCSNEAPPQQQPQPQPQPLPQLA